jgi:prevent-host-death family protein
MVVPSSRFSKTIAAGVGVPLNTHTPLTLPGDTLYSRALGPIELGHRSIPSVFSLEDLAHMTLQKRRSKSLPSSSKRKRRLGSRNKAPQVQAVPLAQVKDDLSKYLRLAAQEEIVITRHGRPAGVLIGFASDDDWFEYRLEHHPEFLRRVADARTAIREGRGILLEELEET